MSIKRQIMILVSGLIFSLVAVTQTEEFFFEDVIQEMRQNLDRNIVLIRRLVLIDMHHDGVSALVYKSLYAKQQGVSADAMLSEYDEFVAEMRQHVDFVFGQKVSEEFEALRAPTLVTLKEFTDAGRSIIEMDSADQLKLQARI